MLRLLACLLIATTALAQLPLPQRYRDAGVLKWGADAEGGAPFVFLDAKNPDQGVIGFEVDLARELGAVLGVEVRRVQAPFATLVQSLERGDCDLAMNGLEPTPSRRAQVRFTRPYYIFLQQLSVGPSVTGVRGLPDLVGKRVTVLGESLSHQLLLEQTGIEVVVYESNVTAYEDVVNGRAAASLADLPIARALRPMFPQLQDVGEPFHPFYYCVAVRAGEPDLQQALDAAIGVLFGNGTLERIYRKWDLWVPAEARLGDADVAQAFARDPEQSGASDLHWGQAMKMLGEAALRTMGISVVSFALAVLLGLVVALVRLHGPLPLRWCAVAYVELLRGTPILVQMLLLYYGLGQIEWLRLDAMTAGILGLSLNYAAYEAEVYRGALLAIPRAQREAASALGFTTAQSLRQVIVPQALRLSLAPSTNDFIALFKDSSIVMVITVVELTKQYQMLANASGRFIVLGLVTSGLYLCMSLPLAYLARRFERRLDRDHA
ncbi:MAG: ABC transporter substrate-binding protein/permease [Planctomycetota bacterium]|nr:ABC transporter substrate-binding protein/permease [Planctomycetota bacterium]